VLLGGALASAQPNLDSGRLAQLGRYEVLDFGDPTPSRIERGKAIGVFDATPEEVFRVVTDFGRWRQFLPRVRGSRVLSSLEGVSEVELDAELPWPAGQRRVVARYRSTRAAGEIYRVDFELVRGQMKTYLGRIYIEPWGSEARPTKCAVTYELVADPDVLAPRSVLNRFIRRSASGFVHALRQQVNELHRLGLLHPLQPEQPGEPPLALPRDAMKAAVSPSNFRP
jgi:ribosome-associated toxin RatA of RatAB toxin-antitoxin module